MQVICDIWLSFVNWFAFLDAPVRAAMIASLGTALSAVFAAWVVFRQIGIQAGKARENNRALEELKLKLEIYDGILSVCRKAMDASLDATDHIRQFSAAINMARVSRNGSVPAQRFASHQANMAKAIMRAVKIANAVEAWEIVDPRIKVFQVAMAAAQHDVRIANQNYINVAMFMFPAPMPDGIGGVFPWYLPADDTRAKLEETGNELIQRLGTVEAYVDDFQREMQKLLIGPLFPKNEVECRNPIDPKFRVIRLDRHKEIMRDFQENTDWGRDNARIKKEVASSFVIGDMQKDV